MPANLSERARGLSSVSEGDVDPSDYPSIDQFNKVFIERMARGAYARWKNMVGAPEAQIIGAIDVRESPYKTSFKSFWEKKGMSVDNAAADVAWKKARTAAISRYVEYTKNPPSERTAMPAPVPKPPVPQAPAESEEELVEAVTLIEEIPPVPEDLRIENWYGWNGTDLTPDSLDRFNAEFVWKMNENLGRLSKDSHEREAQLQEIRDIYMSVVFRMYQNANPGYGMDILNEQFQNTFPSYWKSVLDASDLHLPQS